MSNTPRVPETLRTEKQQSKRGPGLGSYFARVVAITIVTYAYGQIVNFYDLFQIHENFVALAPAMGLLVAVLFMIWYLPEARRGGRSKDAEGYALAAKEAIAINNRRVARKTGSVVQLAPKNDLGAEDLAPVALPESEAEAPRSEILEPEKPEVGPGTVVSKVTTTSRSAPSSKVEMIPVRIIKRKIRTETTTGYMLAQTVKKTVENTEEEDMELLPQEAMEVTPVNQSPVHAAEQSAEEATNA